MRYTYVKQQDATDCAVACLAMVCLHYKKETTITKLRDISTRFSDAFTIKDIFTNIALTLIMDIAMALITGVILFRMNLELFGISIFMTIISILLVFIFKQPYKKINEEQMQQSSILIIKN